MISEAEMRAFMAAATEANAAAITALRDIRARLERIEAALTAAPPPSPPAAPPPVP